MWNFMVQKTKGNEKNNYNIDHYKILIYIENIWHYTFYCILYKAVNNNVKLLKIN